MIGEISKNPMDTPAKKSKPLNWVWLYYFRKNVSKEGKNGIFGDCKYCGMEYRTHVDRMAAHLVKVNLF